MTQTDRRRFPPALIGVVLIAVSVAPTVIGMVRGFNQSQADATPTAVAEGVGVAFHPVLLACGTLGLVLVVTALVRASRSEQKP